MSEQQQIPTKWWQWVLLYPTFLVAIIGAIPTFVREYKALKIGVESDKVSMAEQQNQMWRKNLACSAAPFKWYKNNHNIQIDGTICKSGDVLVRVETPDNRKGFWWVPVDEILQTSSNLSWIPNAYADTFNDDRLYVAQSDAQVVCQRFVGDGRLLRRIDTGQQCIDEIVNTYTGQVIQQNPAPCDPRC